MSVKSESKAFSLDKVDWLKTLRDTALVAAASAVAYLANDVNNWDLGPYTATLVPVIGFILMGLNRFIRDNQDANKVEDKTEETKTEDVK